MKMERGYLRVPVKVQKGLASLTVLAANGVAWMYATRNADEDEQ